MCQPLTMSSWLNWYDSRYAGEVTRKAMAKFKQSQRTTKHSKSQTMPILVWEYCGFAGVPHLSLSASYGRQIKQLFCQLILQGALLTTWLGLAGRHVYLLQIRRSWYWILVGVSRLLRYDIHKQDEWSFNALFILMQLSRVHIFDKVRG